MENEIQSDQDSLLSAIRRGFLVWSWIGLLGAYVTTSAVYAAQLLSIVTRGFDNYAYSHFTSITIAAFLIPIIIISMGWIVFNRYSTGILKLAILSDSLKENNEVLKQLIVPFRIAINYLIMSWVSILFAIFLPYLFAIIRL